MYLYTALPWRKAPRPGPWPRPGLERSVRALGALGVRALRPHVCIALAEARLLDSCLAQPYEAGPAEPTVGLLTSGPRSEEHTSELQSQSNLVCRLLLEKKQ